MKRGPELKHSKHETYRKQIRSMRKIQTQRHQSEAIMLPNACRGRPAECAPRLPEAALDGVEEQHSTSKVHKLVRTRHFFWFMFCKQA